MTRTSRLPGLYARSVAERRRLVAQASGLTHEALDAVLERGGMDVATADKTVENVLGLYALPFSAGLNVQVNGRDYLVPMVIEEPSVVAAASNAARMVREGGGFTVESDAPLMVSQVQLWDVPDAALATARIEAATPALLAEADTVIPGLLEHGGGARAIEVRSLGDGLLVVHVVVDVRDAMGANLVNTVAEHLTASLQKLAGGTVGLRILSNLCDRRCVRVTARVPVEPLATRELDGAAVRDAIVRASLFAERDPYRAVTHNKGVMNGVDAVVLATGNDWRAVEAGVHAYAARSGTYLPLATWRKGDDGSLVGRAELPLALGIVGGTLRVHAGARLALEMMGVRTAQELAMVAASVGVASNLAALRALATEGIQRGHMSLHARSVAALAGAQGDELEQVAALIAEARDVTVQAAQRALERLRVQPERAVGQR